MVRRANTQIKPTSRNQDKMSTVITLEGKSNWVEYHNYIQKTAEDKEVVDILLGKEKIPVEEPMITDAKYQPDTYLVRETETPQDTETPQRLPTDVEYPNVEGSLRTPEQPLRKAIGRRELRNLGILTPSKSTTTGLQGQDDTDNAPAAGTTSDAAAAAATGGTAGTSEFQQYMVYDRIERRAAILFHQDHRRWEQGHKKLKTARKLLYDSVCPSIQALIRKFIDPVEIWNFLVKEYKVSKASARVQLYTALKETTLASCGYDGQTFIRKVFHLRDELEDQGMEMTDEEICTHIMTSLPASYNSFKEKYELILTCQARDGEHDLSTLVNELTKESNTRAKKMKEKKENSKNKSQTQQKFNNDKNKPTSDVCPKCKKPGHTEDKCWFAHPELMPEHIKKKIQVKNDKSVDKDKSNGKDKLNVKLTNRFAGLAVDGDLEHDSGTLHSPSTRGTSADSVSQILTHDLQQCQDAKSSERWEAEEASCVVVPPSGALWSCVAGDIHDRDTCLVDSGCNVHIVNDMKWFVTFNDKLTASVGTADGKLSLATCGSGRVVIKCGTTTDGNSRLLLRHALYAPSARCNLLSLCKLLEENDITQQADHSSMKFFKNGEQVGYAKAVNGLYHLAVSSPSIAEDTPVAAVINFEHPVWKWHRRLGHLSLQNMRNLIKFSDGIDLTDQQIKNMLGAVCPVCATTRAVVKIPRDPAKRRAEIPGQFMHVDTWGKYPIKGWDGTHYFLFFTDDATRFTWCERYSEKKELPELFAKLHNTIQNSLNITIRNYRFDGEFNPGPIARYLQRKNIPYETIEPYAHYQNGVAERPNRTIREKGAAMVQEDNVIRRIHNITVGRTQELMRETKRPESLWPEAVEHAVWLKNRSPARALRKKEKKTPWEALYGNKPSLERERVWGSRTWVTYAHEHTEQYTKLHHPRGWMGYWVGRYSEAVDKVWSPEKSEVCKVGVARIQDGQGLDDPQPDPTYTDRVPTPVIEIPEVPDEQEDDENASDEDDEPEEEETPNNQNENIVEQEDETAQQGESSNEQGETPQVETPRDPEVTVEEAAQMVLDSIDELAIGDGSPTQSQFFGGLAALDDDSDDASYISQMSDTDEDELDEPTQKSKHLPTSKAAALKGTATKSTNSQTVKAPTSIPKGAGKGGSVPPPPKKSLGTESKYIKTAAGPVLKPLHTLVYDPNKCDVCFRFKLPCDRNSVNGPKCSQCKRKSYRCIDITAQSKALVSTENLNQKIVSAAPAVNPCRNCHQNGRTCVFDDNTGICTTCKKNGRKSKCNMDLTGVVTPKEQRALVRAEKKPKSVPDKEKCQRCFDQNRPCDGNIPCDQCKDRPILRARCTKQGTADEVPKDQRPACRGCFNRGRSCNKETPCTTCKITKKNCVYVLDGGLSLRTYPTEGVAQKQSDDIVNAQEDRLKCNLCISMGEGRSRGRICVNNGGPCWACVKDAMNGTNQGKYNHYCVYMRAGGIRDAYLIAPYIAVYNPDHAVRLRDDWEKYIPELTVAAASLETQKAWRIKYPVRAPKIDVPPRRPLQSAAQVAYDSSFPHGAKVISTPGHRLQCMIFAIVLSMLEQHPSLIQPTTDELEAMMSHPSLMLDSLVTGMTNQDTFSADQGGAFLHYWGLQKGLNLQLGCAIHGREPFLVPTPDAQGERHILWVHNDNQQVDVFENKKWVTKSVGHWSGLEPVKKTNTSKTKKRTYDEAEASDDPDQDLYDDGEGFDDLNQDLWNNFDEWHGDNQHEEKKSENVDSHTSNFLAAHISYSTPQNTTRLLPDPQNYKEAMAAPDALEFEKAMRVEDENLKTNHTYDVIDVKDVPPGKRLITSRYAYKRKIGYDNKVKTYKARLCARGFQQREGIDYIETFAAVVKPSSFRILFALAVVLGWHVHQMDVVAAFLNGDLDTYIYMKPPLGMKLSRGKVLRLRKALYGLKQAPRTWWDKFTKTLLSWSWRVSNFDPCVFIDDKNELYLCLWVDDILIFGKNEDGINEFKTKLSDTFKMTDEGLCTFYLGIHVDQKPGSIHLHQSRYVTQMLDRYGFTDTTTSKTPGNPNVKLKKNKDSTVHPDFKLEYQSKVGSLNFASNQTRPDIAFQTGYSARYASNPTQEHMNAVSHLFQYLKGTKDLGLLYRKEAGLTLRGFVDSDFGNCEDTRKSTTGYVFTLAGAPIDWKSKRQDTVAISTMDAEYLAAGAAAAQAIWIRNFINDLRIPGCHIRSVPLYIDNNAALKLTRNPEFHAKSKHIDIKHHFIREKVKDGILDTLRVSSKDNIADLLTKTLGKVSHESLVDKAGLGRFEG